jgi:hypothetical protein
VRRDVADPNLETDGFGTRLASVHSIAEIDRSNVAREYASMLHAR